MTSSSDSLLKTAAYTRDGYILLGQLLDDDCVRQLIAEQQRFRKRDHRLVVITQLMHCSALIREVATRGPHIAALRQLLGNNICLTYQQYVSPRRQQEPASRYIRNRRALAAGQRLRSAGSHD